MPLRFVSKYALPIIAATLLGGCATFRPVEEAGVPPPRNNGRDTTIGRAFRQSEQRHPGKSGFGIIGYDLEALVARVSLADAAESSLDIQSYIFDTDEAGSILTDHLLRAADRGVQVRLLLDDFNVRNDRQLLALCANPRIQVKIFNPKLWRARWLRVPQFLLDFRRLDHRMHNKLFVADNTVAILGGRNVGNDYFNLGTNDAFRDLDLLTVGPVAHEASDAFERYWNSPWSVSINSLLHRTSNPQDLAALRKQIKTKLGTANGFEEDYATNRDQYLQGLENDGHSLVWADGEVVADAPDEVIEPGSSDSPVAQRLEQEWQRARKEVLMECAYFIPGKRGIQTFTNLHDRGVAVTVLTCGLASTDLPIIYSAYRSYRRELLAAGVDLYEFRRLPAEKTKRPRWYRLRPAYAFLHSKALVFDRERVWIGSFNLDPRSQRLNTELVAVVQSPELAEELAGLIQKDLEPDRSWHVHFAKSPDPSPDANSEPSRGAVIWTGAQDGKPVTLTHEPANWWARVFMNLLRLVPGIEKEL